MKLREWYEVRIESVAHNLPKLFSWICFGMWAESAFVRMLSIGGLLLCLSVKFSSVISSSSHESTELMSQSNNKHMYFDLLKLGTLDTWYPQEQKKAPQTYVF